MPVVAFDTLRFTEKLMVGDFSLMQAKAAAEALAEAITQELASKYGRTAGSKAGTPRSSRRG
ncbi:MAG: hypothetical protein FD153_1548 [Rhodospirillaceae bacterium]|nr:MAG: hypothetical protein FD153_1548 [Rhodospirillaceae bacterium]